MPWATHNRPAPYPRPPPNPPLSSASPSAQALLTLLTALPALALRDPQLRGHLLGGNPKFGILFMLLGMLAIPMWMPYVGTLVVTFTLVIPRERGA